MHILFERVLLFMNIKDLIKKILVQSCVFFTIATALYSIVVMTIYVDDTQVLLDASRVLLFFVASFLLACANGVFKIERIHVALRFFIHYLLSTFAFCSCLMLPISPEPSTMTVGIVIFSVTYLIITGIVALFRTRYKSLSSEKKEYKSQFSKK